MIRLALNARRQKGILLDLRGARLAANQPSGDFRQSEDLRVLEGCTHRVHGVRASADASMKAGRQTTLRASDRRQRRRRSFGVAGHADHASGRSRHRHRLRSLRPRRPSDREVRADVRAVTATEFATVLGDAAGPLCSHRRACAGRAARPRRRQRHHRDRRPEVPIMDGSAAPFVAAIDQVGLGHSAARRAAIIRVLKPVRVAQGDSFGELRPYRARLPPRGRDRLRPPADRPPGLRARHRAETLPPRIWRGPAPSASCATWRSSGAPATRSAPRSRTRWWSATTAAQSGRPALRRRVRPPQGARRDRRSGARRRAAARRLPLGARRPQPQPCGAVGADGRPVGLDAGRGPDAPRDAAGRKSPRRRRAALFAAMPTSPPAW